MQKVYIVQGQRTPIGCLMGSLKDQTGVDLGTISTKEVLQKSGINPIEINEVIFGNVLSAGMKQSPSRQISIKSGIPTSVPCWNLNKLCASGLKAITVGSLNIMIGDSNCSIVGGFESMTNTPGLLMDYRKGHKFGHSLIKDHNLQDGYEDAFQKNLMGNFGELSAQKFGISREMQDQYCVNSYERSLNSQKNGFFDWEIAKVQNGSDLIFEDEEPKKFNKKKIFSLKPVFSKDGTITGANASKVNDGACSLLLMSQKMIEKSNMKPLAEIVSFADAELEPERFNETPVHSIQKLLSKNKLQVQDVDCWEINEAFSVTPLVTSKLLNINLEKMNVNGGAVSLGHPVGMSGARIVLSLINVMRIKGGYYGIAGICNGGGGATSILVKNLQ